MRKTKFFTVLLLFFSAFHAMSAQICKSYIPDEHPDSRYTVNNNGTATDTRSGLMWKVCSEGQTWNAGKCEGTAGTFNWQAAFNQADAVNSPGFAGHKDWRVPDVNELTYLAARNCSNPAINLGIFPNTPSNGTYVSSSPYSFYNNNVRVLQFDIGRSDNIKRDQGVHLRLVRYVQ